MTSDPHDNVSRYEPDAIRKVLALFDPVPNEDDLSLDTPPATDAAGYTQAERFDVAYETLIELTGYFDCATPEALSAMKGLSYLENVKIHEEIWTLVHEANI